MTLSHGWLLDYSEQVDSLILPKQKMPSKRNKGSQQAPTEQPATTSNYNWTEEEKQTLRENLVYFEKMKDAVTRAEKNGPQGLPKKK